MPPREDRLLEILKSLRPPEGAGAGTRPEPPPPAKHGTIGDAPPPQSSVAPVPGPQRPVASSAPPSTDMPVSPDPAWKASPARKGWLPGGAISLRIEEVGLFFFAAVVLIVLAFLMGWYGRSLSGPDRIVSVRDAEPPPMNMRPLSRPDALDLGTRDHSIRQVSAGTREVYSILVARFPAGGEAEAEDHRKLLEERGYTPAWIRRTTSGVELCVGRFETPGDRLLLEWLRSLRRLHGAYARSIVVRIPRE